MNSDKPNELAAKLGHNNYQMVWFGLARRMQKNWFGIPKYLHGRNCAKLDSTAHIYGRVHFDFSLVCARARVCVKIDIFM